MNTPEENNIEEDGPEENRPEENRPEESTDGFDNGDGGRSSESTEQSDAATDGRAEGPGADRRPLGYWLRVVDARLTREFRSLFEADALDRRDWMILNAIAGTVDGGPVAARLERGGRRLRALVDRGWVAGSPGSWTLTDEGRTAFERLQGKVSQFRARVAGAVSPEDFATTLASLEAIAAELGEGDDDFDRSRGRRRGFRPGFGWSQRWRGFHPGFEPGERWGAGMHPHHGHGHHAHHGHGGNDGHGCHHGGTEFAHHGGPEFGHRHGGQESGHRHGHGHDGRGPEDTSPKTPTTEV